MAQGRRRPQAIALTEPWISDSKPLPSLEGYSRVFAAPRPGGRGGASLALDDSWAVCAKEWHSRPTDGVLWVRLDGALPEGQALFLVVCYLPPVGSGGCPRDTEEWWQRLQADWAQAEGLGLPLMCGDLNAHTACEPDWPEDEEGWQPRRSSDRQKPSTRCHGVELLEFCRGSSARLCNGRVPGGSSGAATSFGVGGAAQSVVDYFVASANLLPLLTRLEVLPNHPAAELSDHAVLCLDVQGPAQQQRQQQIVEPPWPSSNAQQSAAAQRQFRLDPERLTDALTALEGLSLQLAALVDAVDVAGDMAALEAVSAGFSEVVCTALENAHMREMVFGGQQGRQQQERQPLPRHVRKQFGISEARQAKRSAQPGSEEWVVAKQDLKRRLRQAHRAAKGLRGEKLEQMAAADPIGFYLRYRSSPHSAPSSLLPLVVAQHFAALLGGTAAAREEAFAEATAAPAADSPNGVLSTLSALSGANPDSVLDKS